MKFHLNLAEGLNLFTAYDADYVSVNQQRYPHQHLLLTPTTLSTEWPVIRFEDLSAAHFEALLTHSPEIILLGTGKTIRFPHPSLTAPLMHARIGFEVMDNQAACRTYNILASEGRRVLVVLLPHA